METGLGYIVRQTLSLFGDREEEEGRMNWGMWRRAGSFSTDEENQISRSSLTDVKRVLLGKGLRGTGTPQKQSFCGWSKHAFHIPRGSHRERNHSLQDPCKHIYTLCTVVKSDEGGHGLPPVREEPGRQTSQSISCNGTAAACFLFLK